MKENKHDRHDRHDEHEGKKERRRKKGHGGLLLLIVFLIILLIAAAFLLGKFGFGNGWFGSGDASGDGSGSGTDTSAESSASVSDSSSDESADENVIIIRIDGNNIYFDGTLCNDENMMANKISEVGNTKEYKLDHENAIKATYDKVVAKLSELETALDIKVDYGA